MTLPVVPWVILFFAALNIIFLGGKRRAFGSFIAELRKNFNNTSLTELNWIGDSYAAVAYLSSGLSTTLILYFNRRYDVSQLVGSMFILVSCLTSSFVPNPHWMFLTHTVFHGIGSSLVITTVGLVTNEHFDKKHPYHILATTLVSGGSLAAVAFVYLFSFVIHQYNWRVAFIILGILYFFVNSSAALVFRKNEQSTEMNSKGIKYQINTVHYWQTSLLVLWFLERVITSVVTYGLMLNLTDYVYRTQHNLVQSSILTTLFAAGEGITYLIAAIATALTKTFFKNKLGYILLCSSIIGSLALFTMEFRSHVIVESRLLCFIAGFGIGPSNTLLFPAGEELTKLPGHMAYSFSLGGMGVGMLISPLLTANIAEIFMYKWFFLVQGCLMMIKSVCLLIIVLLLASYRKKGYYDIITVDYDINVETAPSDETQKLILGQKIYSN